MLTRNIECRERIEIFDADLLNQNKELMQEFLDLSQDLGVSYGWHYFLDFVWAVQEFGDVSGKVILDAGASTGLLQWWLANKGAKVISVDLEDRSNIDNKFSAKYRISGMRKSDYYQYFSFKDILPSRKFTNWSKYPQKIKNFILKVSKNTIKAKGEIVFYRQNLMSMPEIEDESVDMVVSISALEHNSIKDIIACSRELMRVLKNNGKMILTLSAAKDNDWFHEQSQGWCLSEKTLRSIFSIHETCPTNFNQYDYLYRKLEECKLLQDILPKMYFTTGESGLPWGIWKPQYLPVGLILKKKN